MWRLDTYSTWFRRLWNAHALPGERVQPGSAASRYYATIGGALVSLSR